MLCASFTTNGASATVGGVMNRQADSRDSNLAGFGYLLSVIFLSRDKVGSLPGPAFDFPIGRAVNTEPYMTKVLKRAVSTPRKPATITCNTDSKGIELWNLPAQLGGGSLVFYKGAFAKIVQRLARKEGLRLEEWTDRLFNRVIRCYRRKPAVN